MGIEHPAEEENALGPVSTIRNRKGWSARKSSGSLGIMTARAAITTPVAAAASVPSSFTSTNALCKTAEMESFSSELIPVKSARFVIKRQRHAHGREGGGQRELRRQLEPRKKNLDLLPLQPVHPAGQALNAQLLLEGGESVDLVGQKHDRRQVAVP